MSNYYLQLGVLTTTTVLKLMFAIVMGFAIMPFFEKPEETLTGLSYIVIHIFLPCILGPRLLMNVTWDVMLKYYWAPILICVPISIGLLCTSVTRLLIDKKYRGLLMFMCICHDGLTFPLGLILTIKGLTWLTPEAVLDAQTYVFLCNFVCSIAVWAFGNPWIKYCNRKELLANATPTLHRTHNCKNASAIDNPHNNMTEHFEEEVTRNEMSTSSSLSYTHSSCCTSDELHNSNKAPHVVEPLAQLEHYEISHRSDQPIRVNGKQVFYPPTLKESASPSSSSLPSSPLALSRRQQLAKREWEQRHQSVWDKFTKFCHKVWAIISSPPLFSSIIGLVIALTPPLKVLAETQLGENIVNGLSFLGNAAIPITLFVLGCVIANNRRATMSNIESVQPMQSEIAVCIDFNNNSNSSNNSSNKESLSSMSGLSKLCNIFTPERIFILLTLITRLIIIPAISLLVIHVLAKINVIPSDRPFLLAVLLETCSPCPNNAPLICLMHNYHTKICAKVTFIMYITCSATIAFWLFIYIIYLGRE